MEIIDVLIFESDEEEMMERYERIRRPKRFHARYTPARICSGNVLLLQSYLAVFLLCRINFFDEMNEIQFLNRFRLKKETCFNLLREIEDEIKSQTNRNNALSPATKLFVTLRFYATGSMLLVAGDFAGVSKTAACECIKEVILAIARKQHRYVKFPETREEREDQKLRFYRIARFPNVLGTIDCTHVKIESPGGPNAEEYRNRKGFFSWNVQIVCDDKLRIQDIVARWPGRAHDQTVFNNSRIRARFEIGEMGNALLLGDSGYGIRNFLITPLANPHTPAQNLFNESQIRTRNVVERAFGVWKRRFPILSFGMRVSLERSKAIIVAAAVLHNIALNAGDGEPHNDIAMEVQNFDNLVNNDNEDDYQVNNATRVSLINNHFAHLL